VNSLLPFIVTGIVTGSVYGLAALGLVLTYRTSGVFNFGHGAIGAGAAFLFYTLHVTHHMPWPAAAAITLVVFGVVVGWIMEFITRGLGDVPEAVVVVATVGILLGVEGYLYLQYGDVTRRFPDFLPTSGFRLSGVNISWSEVITVVLSAAAAAVLYMFLRRSRLGIAMRAVVDNPTLVALAGDRPTRVRQAAWAIGSAFAAMSGILLAPTLGLDANLLTLLVVQAFGACAIGLFTSLPLTYLGGLGVGIAASLATKYFTHRPFNGVPPAVPFIILLVVLLVVPAAKLPKRRASLRSLVPDIRPMSPRAALGLTAVGIAALAVVPAVVGPHLPVWIAGLVDVIIFASLALLVWTSGQISLCHAAFVAVGACAMGHLTSGGHVPWALALVLAGLITVPVGALVAIPAIRMSGLYLALATLGFGILMQDVVFPTRWMFGSALSVTAPRPRLGAFNGSHDKQLYYLVLVVAVISLGIIAAVVRSRLGRLLRAMAETPTMLATHGLNVNMTRLIVFCVSSFFAGVAGALVVTQFGSASGVGYGPIQSLLFLAVLAICGTRIIRSSVLAAGLLAVLPGYLTTFSVDRQTFAFGAIAVAAGIVIARRADIAALWAQLTTPTRPARPSQREPIPRRPPAQQRRPVGAGSSR
jgi:branched-subunit amino acid ABC-type transport system permease component